MGQVRDIRHFGNDKDVIKSNFAASMHSQIRFTRFKGWGEASPTQLEAIAFSPETRNLVVLSMNDEDEAGIETIMGKDVEHRKELLFGTTNEDGDE